LCELSKYLSGSVGGPVVNGYNALRREGLLK